MKVQFVLDKINKEHLAFDKNNNK